MPIINLILSANYKDAVRKFLAILVASAVGIFSPYRSARADELDEFEQNVDVALREYQNIVHEFVENERAKIAPTQIEQGIENAISISQKALVIVREEVVSDIDLFNTAVATLDKIVASVSLRWRLDTIVDLEGYDQLLQDVKDYERQAMTATATLSRIRENLIGMREYISQYDSFCDRNVPRLNLSSLSLTPFSTKLQPNSQQIDPRRFMQDPLARGQAITSGATSFAAGVAIYAAVYGWDAAMSLFAVEAGAGSVTIGSSSPWGWVIIFAAVAIAYYVGMWRAKENNDERERRAQKAWNKLMRGVEDSQKWFASHRLTEREYREMAMPICREQETKSDGRLKKLVESSNETLLKLDHQLHDLDAISNTLEKNSQLLTRATGQYEKNLITSYGRSLVEQHRQAILSEQRVGEAIRYFNEEIKSQWIEFSDFYVANIINCTALDLHAKDLTQKLIFHSGIIQKSYKDQLNQNHLKFSEIEAMTAGIVERIKGRVQRCVEGFDLGDIPPEIYPLP